MEVTDTFIPTAGVVGLLPMVTYFFLVVTMFAFTGNSIFTLSTQPYNRPELRIAHILTAIIAVITAITYYLIQTYYQEMLRDLATVTDTGDRQILVRESYNALSQYRYMDWFITAPLILIQVVSRLNLQFWKSRRSLIMLFVAASFMFFASFIGHQQLSFDNEIQTGPRIIWGIIATIAYGFSLFTLYRLWQQFREQTTYSNQRAYRLTALLTGISWGIYLIGYFLTVIDIDFNWLHIAFALTDLIHKIGVGLVIYFVSISPIE